MPRPHPPNKDLYILKNKIKNLILMHFKVKNIFNHHRYHNFKQTLNLTREFKFFYGINFKF